MYLRKAYKTCKILGLKKEYLKVAFPDLSLLHEINSILHAQRLIFPIKSNKDSHTQSGDVCLGTALSKLSILISTDYRDAFNPAIAQ